MDALHGSLRAAADEIGMTSQASFFFNRLRHTPEAPKKGEATG
jgi:hypothetical protein